MKEMNVLPNSQHECLHVLLSTLSGGLSTMACLQNLLHQPNEAKSSALNQPVAHKASYIVCCFKASRLLAVMI